MPRLTLAAFRRVVLRSAPAPAAAAAALRDPAHRHVCASNAAALCLAGGRFFAALPPPVPEAAPRPAVREDAAAPVAPGIAGRANGS